MTLPVALKIALAAICALATAPFVLTLGTGLVATALGCQLNEGDVHACVVFGLDIGYALYAAAMTGIIMLFGLPLAGLAFLIWLSVAGIVVFVRWRRSDC